MSTFLKRTISGTLFVIIIIGSILLGRYSFLLVFISLMLFSLYEFYKICLHSRVRPQVLYGMLIGALIFMANYFFAIGQIGSYIFLGLIPLLLSIFIIELYRNQNKPIHNIGFTLLGLLYVALPFALINYIVLSYSSYRIGYQSHLLIGFFALAWANDSGAYAVGVSIGKNKLFPKISPKKSWEGLIGGFFTTALVAWIISMIFPEVSIVNWFFIGFITAVMSVFGDLVESMFKRSIGVKDSGKFLPGHGGVLDRFDGILFAAPVVFVYLEMMMLI
ncbi:MAG TPA: phosphatidate cytidylyltransferase [Tenuifilaceae bacterium]|nr:phosphatidate cytidylyltransferase [Tenuifilaceae bacterium]HRX67358.1 phosphatidate cytidylyltransferase [Tenuifilaceae bacterium]